MERILSCSQIWIDVLELRTCAEQELAQTKINQVLASKVEHIIENIEEKVINLQFGFLLAT